MLTHKTGQFLFFHYCFFIAWSCTDCLSVMHFSSLALCVSVFRINFSKKFLKKGTIELALLPLLLDWMAIAWWHWCWQCQQCRQMVRKVRWESINWSWIRVYEIEWSWGRLLALFLMEHVHMELMDASSAFNNDAIHVRHRH